MLGFDQKAGTGTFQSGKMIIDNEPTTSSDIPAKKSANRWKRRLSRDAEPAMCSPRLLTHYTIHPSSRALSLAASRLERGTLLVSLGRGCHPSREVLGTHDVRYLRSARLPGLCPLLAHHQTQRRAKTRPYLLSPSRAPARDDLDTVATLTVGEEVDMAAREQGVSRSYFLRQAIERNLRHYLKS